MFFTEIQKIGIGLTSFGVFFMFVGIIFFFDAGLLAIGNILFLAGVTLLIGPQSTMSFFFQKRKWKGTSAFIVGIILVFMKWALFGILVEIFGFINLFGDFFPMIISFIRSLPLIGPALNVVLTPLEKIFGSYQKLPI